MEHGRKHEKGKGNKGTGGIGMRNGYFILFDL